MIEQHAQRRVPFSGFLPHADVVHEFLDGGGCGLDFLLGFVGAGDGGEGGGFAQFVGCPGELACLFLGVGVSG